MSREIFRQEGLRYIPLLAPETGPGQASGSAELLPSKLR